MQNATSRRPPLIAVLCIALTCFAAEAAARCGDDPGDAAGIVATRARIDEQCNCETAPRHGVYVRCASDVVRAAVDDGTLAKACRSSVLGCARKSICGRPGKVTCCRTTRTGKQRCSIRSADRCIAPSGGSACTGSVASCCDACALTGGCTAPTPELTPTAAVSPFTPTSSAVSPTPAAATATPVPAAPTDTAVPSPTPTATPTATIPAICQAQIGLPPIAEVPFTIKQGTNNCGGPLLSPNASPPLSGHIEDASGASLGDLGLGCLYAGGLPPVPIPDGATSIMSAVGISGANVTLGGSDGSGPKDCTRAAGPGRHCSNGSPGIDGGGTCTQDADCGGLSNTCNLDANCYFGPPIPVPGAFPACVVNAFEGEICGTTNLLSGSATLAAVLSARVYLTTSQTTPCPQCLDGACSDGPNAGRPCTAVGSLLTSIDCPPPDEQFLTALQVTMDGLTTDQSTLAAPDGLFCPGQFDPGALGLFDATKIVQQGSPLLTGGGLLGGLLGGTLLDMNVAGSFCIPVTNTLVDAVALLPGPGTISVAGSLDLTQLLNGPAPTATATATGGTATPTQPPPPTITATAQPPTATAVPVATNTPLPGVPTNTPVPGVTATSTGASGTTPTPTAGGGATPIGTVVIQLGPGSQAILQTRVSQLDPLSLSGHVTLEIGAPDANGVAPIVVPADGTHIDPVPVTGVGTACVVLTRDGIGSVDCDGGSAGYDLSFFADHDTTPGAAGNSGSANGLPDDPECDDSFTYADGSVSSACLEGSPCDDTSPAKHPGACNSPTVMTSTNSYPAGGMQLVIGQRISVLQSGQTAQLGPDGQPCTADDAPGIVTESTSVLTTGSAQILLYDATNNANISSRIGPGSLTTCTAGGPACPAGETCFEEPLPPTNTTQPTCSASSALCRCRIRCGAKGCAAAGQGAVASCPSLASGVASGSIIGGGFPSIDLNPLGDAVITFQFVAQ